MTPRSHKRRALDLPGRTAVENESLITKSRLQEWRDDRRNHPGRSLITDSDMICVYDMNFRLLVAEPHQSSKFFCVVHTSQYGMVPWSVRYHTIPDHNDSRSNIIFSCSMEGVPSFEPAAMERDYRGRNIIRQEHTDKWNRAISTYGGCQSNHATTILVSLATLNPSVVATASIEA